MFDRLPDMTEDVDFLRLLGVTVVEVADMGGMCAAWTAETRTLEVCAHLCPRRRARVMQDALSRVEAASE